MAGEGRFEKGELVLNNSSGHFRPTEAQGKKVISFFRGAKFEPFDFSQEDQRRAVKRAMKAILEGVFSHIASRAAEKRSSSFITNLSIEAATDTESLSSGQGTADSPSPHQQEALDCLRSNVLQEKEQEERPCG